MLLSFQKYNYDFIWILYLYKTSLLGDEPSKTIHQIFKPKIPRVYQLKFDVHQKLKFHLKSYATFILNLKTNHHEKNHLTITCCYRI